MKQKLKLKKKDMNVKQKILKYLYPVIMRLSKSAGGKGKVIKNEKKVTPQTPFYSLKAVHNSGKEFDFSQYKGKKVLLVNTASDCGYTGQFDELQKLHEKLQDKIAIVGFPANDFKEQEKGNDHEISEFCRLNYGVTFPLSQKTQVIKGANQNPVYEWLTNSRKNGWNSFQPEWNFSKYLIDENGNLTHYFGPAVSPLDEAFMKEVNK